MPVGKDGFWVFLSSTSDLASERSRVADHAPLSFRIYRFERDRARRQSPEERLREVIEDDTDVFVGLYGERYGSPYPDAEQRRSIVEWEFDTAAERPRLEMQGFVRRPLDEAALEDAQRDFLDRVRHFRNGIWIEGFASVDELSAQVNQALLEWLAEVREEENKASFAERERQNRLSRWMVLTIAFATAAITAYLVLRPSSDLLLAAVVQALAALVFLYGGLMLGESPQEA